MGSSTLTQLHTDTLAVDAKSFSSGLSWESFWGDLWTKEDPFFPVLPKNLRIDPSLVSSSVTPIHAFEDDKDAALNWGSPWGTDWFSSFSSELKPPENIQAVAQRNDISLTWDDPTDIDVRYAVFRSEQKADSLRWGSSWGETWSQAENFSLTRILPKNKTGYLDRGLDFDRTFSYQLATIIAEDTPISPEVRPDNKSDDDTWQQTWGTFSWSPEQTHHIGHGFTWGRQWGSSWEENRPYNVQAYLNEDETGYNIRWGGVGGADRYFIYRSTSPGEDVDDYTALGSTEETSFDDIFDELYEDDYGVKAAKHRYRVSALVIE